MAKVKLNPVLEKLQGAIGDLVFKRYNDEVVISRKPDMSRVEPSAAQVAHQQRFREATLYGKMVMADPESKTLYADAAKAKGQPVFSLTVADFFNAPSVDVVDVSGYSGAAGDEIVIRASDDFAVTQVAITLADSEGNALESGQASPGAGVWRYTATTSVAPGTTVRMVIAATDRPGGMGEVSREVVV